MLYYCQPHAVPGSVCLGMLQASYILPARSAILRIFESDIWIWYEFAPVGLTTVRQQGSWTLMQHENLAGEAVGGEPSFCGRRGSSAQDTQQVNQ